MGELEPGKRPIEIDFLELVDAKKVLKAQELAHVALMGFICEKPDDQESKGVDLLKRWAEYYRDVFVYVTARKRDGPQAAVPPAAASLPGSAK